MTPEQFERALHEFLAYDDTEAVDALLLTYAETFTEAEVKSSERGLVVRATDGAEFHLVIVQTKLSLAQLRTYRPKSRNPQDFYCPLCTCRKSGAAETANGRDESCEDHACRCHEGSAM